MRRTQPAFAGSEDCGRGHEPRNTGSLGSWKRQGVDSPSNPTEGMKPSQHFDLSLVRHGSGTWPPELQDNKSVLF